jgi:hypothetical protein
VFAAGTFAAGTFAAGMFAAGMFAAGTFALLGDGMTIVWGGGATGAATIDGVLGRVHPE